MTISNQAIAAVERWRLARRKWNAEHPNEMFRAHIKHRYGISLEDYEAIHDLQDGRCAICLKGEPVLSRLCVDHDHKTGVVRGLLCSGCNKAIGLFKDNPSTIEAAAVYLREQQCATA